MRVYAIFSLFSLGSLTLYSYLEAQNTCTQLQMALSKKEKSAHLIEEEICRLAYEVEKFESPAHLIEIATRPQFRHLKHPLLQEVLSIPEALAFHEP